MPAEFIKLLAMLFFTENSFNLRCSTKLYQNKINSCFVSSGVNGRWKKRPENRRTGGKGAEAFYESTHQLPTGLEQSKL